MTTAVSNAAYTAFGVARVFPATGAIISVPYAAYNGIQAIRFVAHYSFHCLSRGHQNRQIKAVYLGLAGTHLNKSLGNIFNVWTQGLFFLMRTIVRCFTQGNVGFGNLNRHVNSYGVLS